MTIQKKYKIVFLYTELASYFISCAQALAESGKAEVHIVRWPLNKEAPFDFNFPASVKVYTKTGFTSEKLHELVNEINPDLIYCSGWVDKLYRKICKKYVKKIPVVVGIDNQWDGSFKQRLAGWLNFIFIKPYYNAAWVPGESQKKFALHLGFSSEKIQTGYYCADTDHFHKFYLNNRENKKQHFPKRFIYVGRYLQFKGIFEMWEAFIELQNENPNEWELWCLGTGAKYDQRKEHEKIKHFGFVQPREIEEHIKNTGVFILPSTFEPWGVVVHEFAASGFPMICTDKVGAAERFLEENKNGFLIETGSKSAIKEAMKKMMKKTDAELFDMGEQSVKKAMELTPEIWVRNLVKFIEKP